MTGRRRRYADEPDDTGARGVARVPATPAGPPVPPPDRPDDTGAVNNPLSLIPGPDETTILPRIPSHAESAALDTDREIPQSRRRRPIRRHRDDAPIGGRRTRVVVRSFAELLATIGGVVLLFSAYLLWGTSAEIHNAQDRAGQQLTDSWAGPGEDPTLDPVPGNAIARLYMTKIRPEPWIIVEGTTLADIETAPGHYEDSAMPGDKGNFAVAGHNVPAIFRALDELEPGDNIVVETKTKFYIYQVTEHAVVKPTDVDVVAPVPNEPGVEPGEGDRWITLTTCHPWWDNYERYIVWGKLSSSQNRGNELPPEAKG